jgi:hypothetical protein
VNEASRDSVAAAAVAAAATARSGDKQMQRRRPREKKKNCRRSRESEGGDSTWVSGLRTGPGMDRPSPFGTQVTINYENN